VLEKPEDINSLIVVQAFAENHPAENVSVTVFLDNRQLKTLTTDANGIAKVRVQKPGTYYFLFEKQDTEPYLWGEAVVTFKLRPDINVARYNSTLKICVPKGPDFVKIKDGERVYIKRSDEQGCLSFKPSSSSIVLISPETEEFREVAMLLNVSQVPLVDTPGSSATTNMQVPTQPTSAPPGASPLSSTQPVVSSQPLSSSPVSQEGLLGMPVFVMLLGFFLLLMICGLYMLWRGRHG
jgi:hypothetical protein